MIEGGKIGENFWLYSCMTLYTSRYILCAYTDIPISTSPAPLLLRTVPNETFVAIVVAFVGNSSLIVVVSQLSVLDKSDSC